MADTNQPLNTLLARARAAAWDQGFYAGQAHGQALQKHDPQWDCEGEPERPENPHLWAAREQA